MTHSRQPEGLAHPASHCLLKNDSRAGRGRMSLLILCLAVTIASAAIAGYCYQSHRQIMTAARTMNRRNNK